MSYERRDYGGGAVASALNGAITSGATTFSLTVVTGWPDGNPGPFYATIDPGLPTEERILVTTRTSTTLNPVTRGVDGTSAAAHDDGAVVVHGFTATEADEANLVVSKTVGAVTAKGDIIAATGNQALGKLAVGTNGLPLVAASGETTGLTYSALTATGLASDAVTTAKILNANVTTAKIADANVTTAKIAADSITSALIADDQIDSEHYVDGSIDTAHLADDAVTAAKLDPSIPLGVVGTPAHVTSNQTGITSVADVTDGSITWTALANRKYEHMVSCIVANDTVGSATIITICDASNNVLKTGRMRAQAAGGNGESLAMSWIETGISAGSVTRKLRVSASSGTSSIMAAVGALDYSIKDVGGT